MAASCNDHARLDERSLALHRRVADKLAADPGLLELARANVRRWQASYEVSSQALAEWDKILESSLDDIMALLVDHSENAIRLRQSSPFAGVLTEAERKAIYESYSTRTFQFSRDG
jgi:hypothetical protein